MYPVIIAQRKDWDGPGIEMISGVGIQGYIPLITCDSDIDLWQWARIWTLIRPAIWIVIRLAICIVRYVVGTLHILVGRDNLSHIAECIEYSDGTHKCDGHSSIRIRIPPVLE